MTQQPEALRLADAMLNYWDERGPDAEAVGAELRRLHGFEVAYGVMMTQAESRIITLEAALRQAVEALNTARLSCVAETTTTAIDEALTAARQALEGSMTDRELMQQALEALEEFCEHQTMLRPIEKRDALRERLAQPEAPVLTNIDCSCGRKWRIVNNTLTASEPETVMAEYKFQTYAAYKTDGEMKIGVVPQRTHWEGCEEVHPECRKPEQEPVAWMHPSWIDPDTRGWANDSFNAIHIEGWVPVYTAPRQWQGLTEQEIKDCEKQAMVNGSLPFEQQSFFARAIEAKLKEKNT